MNNFNEKYGPWALVTGASSGIGEQFARQLAAKGMNLVLVARRQQRLERLSEELRDAAGIDIRTVRLDLTIWDFIQQIREATADIDVGLVVNNAGALVMGRFLESSIDDEISQIDLNVRAPMIIAHEFAPRLARRGRGGMIFVASTLAYQGTPLAANYAATKAHVLSFAEGLAHEMQPLGVDILALSPGLTVTEMTRDIDTSTLPMKPMRVEPVVSQAIADLGRRWSTIPGFTNRLMAVLGRRLFTRRFNTRLMGNLFAKMKSLTQTQGTPAVAVRA